MHTSSNSCAYGYMRLVAGICTKCGQGDKRLGLTRRIRLGKKLQCQLLGACHSCMRTGKRCGVFLERSTGHLPVFFITNAKASPLPEGRRVHEGSAKGLNMDDTLTGERHRSFGDVHPDHLVDNIVDSLRKVNRCIQERMSHPGGTGMGSGLDL